MSSVAIYHNNAVEFAVLSGGSWDVNLSLERLRDPRPKLKAQSTDLLLTSTQFRIDLLDTKLVSGIQLVATNLSGAAFYKVSWYSDETYTTQVGATGFINVGTSINWGDTNEWLNWEDTNFWLGTAFFVDPDNLGRDIRIQIANSPMRHIKIEIDDGNNPDGNVKIGYVYIGDVYIPSINYMDNTFSRVPKTSMRESVHGTRYYERRAPTKRLKLGWNVLPSSEAFGELDDLINVQGLDKPVYIDPNPADVSLTGNKLAFLGTLNNYADISKQLAMFESGDNSATISLEFTQVI